MTATLEHLNITVSNPDETAALLVDIFGWAIRWDGPAKLDGRTIHVGVPGEGNGYLAIYATPQKPIATPSENHVAHTNHIGILVDDLEATEQRVLAAGLAPHSHGDYEPGRRFYFDNLDGIEYEVVSYR